LNVYNEKIDKFIPSGNKESLSNDFSDIQTDVVEMISELELGSTQSESSSKSSEKKDELTIQNTKIEN